jgi:catechol 2,3-dioxygenase-like lactoylglutathione lyase family enzyme
MRIALLATVLAAFVPAITAAQVPAPPVPAMAGFALANIALSTDRPDELARWYGDVLGFRVVSRSPGVEGVQTLIIERDGVQIDLIRVPNQRPREAPVDPPRHLEVQGLRNLVFWVDDLVAANAHLRNRGVPMIWEGLYVDGIRTSITAFRDPDGNLVALWARWR